MNITVSIIIPVYNGARYIERAIKSVLIQKVALEVIVIDDCSTDNIIEILLKFKDERVIYKKNSNNLGVAKSRNIGVKNAKGKYIAFLDADDWWEPNKLIEQIRLIEKSNAVLCYTGRRLVNEEGIATGKYVRTYDFVNYKKLLFYNCIPCSSVLVIGDVIKKTPMTNDNYHEDYITWLRLLKNDKYAVGINKPMLNYRLSNGGKSRNKLKSIGMTYGVYRVNGICRLLSMIYTCSHFVHSLTCIRKE